MPLSPARWSRIFKQAVSLHVRAVWHRHAGVVQAVRALQGNCSVRLIDVLKLLKQQRPEQPVKREHADDGRGDKLSPDRETLY